MGLRRLGRECAIQFLYASDFVPTTDLEAALLDFWALVEVNTATRDFTEKLIRGTIAHQAEVDEKIKTLADNWDFHRIAAVDRSILRLAIYEMLFCPDIPPVVSINEAIEIAKRFSTEDSGKFVNGLLDRVKQDLLRPSRQAAGS